MTTNVGAGIFPKQIFLTKTEPKISLLLSTFYDNLARMPTRIISNKWMEWNDGLRRVKKNDFKWALTGSVFRNVLTAGCSNCDWCITENLLLLFGSMLVQSAVLCSALLLNIHLFTLTKCVDNNCVSVFWLRIWMCDVYAVAAAPVLYSPVAFLSLTADGILDDGDLFWVWCFLFLRSICSSQTSK